MADEIHHKLIKLLTGMWFFTILDKLKGVFKNPEGASQPIKL